MLLLCGELLFASSIQTALLVDYNGQSIFTGAVPVVSSCGTGPVVASYSNSNVGTVLVGSSGIGGRVISCTVTFGAAFTNPPACVVSSAISRTFNVSSTTAAVVVESAVDFAGTSLYYGCF